MERSHSHHEYSKISDDQLAQFSTSYSSLATFSSLRPLSARIALTIMFPFSLSNVS